MDAHVPQCAQVGWLIGSNDMENASSEAFLFGPLTVSFRIPEITGIWHSGAYSRWVILSTDISGSGSSMLL